MSDTSTGGVPARRAVTRWAWRLLRRDWRQHLLIVLLLTASVAAAVGFACATYNVAPASGRADFGDANHWLRLNNADRRNPESLQAQVQATAEHFGAIDAIGFGRSPYRGRSSKSTTARSSRTARSAHRCSSCDRVAIPRRTAKLRSPIGSPIHSTRTSARRSISTAYRERSSASSRTRATSTTSSSCCHLSAFADSDFVLVLFDGDEDQIQSLRLPGVADREVSSRGDAPEDLIAAMLVLVATTVVLLLVALIAAASFTVIAQRRLPQLGMMAAVGASEKHLRLTMIATGTVTGIVSALAGAAIGLVGWVVLAPSMAGAVGYRIDALNIPWWLVITACLAGDTDRLRCRLVARASHVAHPDRGRVVGTPAAAGTAASFDVARRRPARRRHGVLDDRRPSERDALRRSKWSSSSSASWRRWPGCCSSVRS